MNAKTLTLDTTARTEPWIANDTLLAVAREGGRHGDIQADLNIHFGGSIRFTSFGPPECWCSAEVEELRNLIVQTQEATVALSGHSSPMHVPRELIVQALHVYDLGNWRTVWQEETGGSLVVIESDSTTTEPWIPPVGQDC